MMDKLKRYECCGDRDGIAWLMIDGHQETEMDYCYMNSDVETLEAENERLKAENEALRAKHNIKRATIMRVSYIDKVIGIEDKQLNRLIDHLKSQIVNESFD